ncbi:MAG TPA: hypothetical protein VM677_01490 [Actinokineospora sp.]|nr:hypothetical protein [Actinokineospora sp.]
MKRADFDGVLREFDSQIRRHPTMEQGKKAKRKYVTREGVQFDFITDKWGWDSESGWKFIIRVVDTNQLDQWGYAPFEAGFDVLTSMVADIVGEASIASIYDDRPELGKETQAYWFAFDTQDRLRALLILILDPALDVIGTWVREHVTK